MEILLCCVEGMLLLLSGSAQYNSYTAGLIQAGDCRLACFVYRILWATYDYIALDTVLLVVYKVHGSIQQNYTVHCERLWRVYISLV